MDGADARRGSTRPCSSASAPRSTSTPGSCPRRPGWMQSAGLEWAYRLAHEPRAPVAALPALQPALRDRVRARIRRATGGARTSLRPVMDYDVAIIGCGRVGLPLALAFADAGLRTLGVDNDPARLDAVARGPDAVRGARRARGADACRRRPGRSPGRTASPTPRRARSIVITLGTPSISHIEIDLRHDPRGARRPAGVLRDGHAPRAALDDRARHDRRSSPATSTSTAAWSPATTSSSPTCPSGSPPGSSSTRSTRCRASSAASASAPARPRRQLFETLGAPIVQTTPVPGRAGEDLDQHPALRDVRAARTC